MKLIKNIFENIRYKNKLPQNISLKDKWLFETHEHTFLHEVNLYKGHEVTFWPEHILINKRRIWRKELTNHYIASREYVIRRNIKSLLRKTVRLKGKYIILTDDWSWSYFHWTADALQRAFLLKVYFKEYKLLIPAHFKQYSYIMQSLQMLDAEIVFINENENLIIEELLFASPLGSSGLFRYDFIKELSYFFRNHQLVSALTIESPEKIYISRGKASYRKILNESSLIQLLKSEGFNILYAEQHNYLSQVKYFSNCKYLVSLHGGGLTNELYLPPTARVLEIRHPKDHLNNCYYLLATALSIPYYYFLADTDNDDTHAADMTVDLEKFETTLLDFLNAPMEVDAIKP